MSTTPLKQQIVNYSRLFKQMFRGYYSQQKKLFWLVQLLMSISTIAGVFWMLSIILGVSHYQNPSNTGGFKYLLFSWMYQLPQWQWLLLASIAGIVSAWTQYLSIKIGVNSVLSYQKYLSKECIKLVSIKENAHWTKEFEQKPKIALLRLLRQGIQLTGLVARRITRAFISLVIFIVALVVLIYLDGKLLSLMLPMALMYIVALYFINRYAARVSTQAAENLPIAGIRFGELISDVLNQNCDVESKEFKKQYDDSMFMLQAELKYKRRLAEIHVSWLNSLFLVIGVAIIIVYIVYIQTSQNIDWQLLLFFLIALRYAASSLQQISATTVAFSRFLPEIDLVYRLINSVKNNKGEKLEISESCCIYIPANRLDQFELEQLKVSLLIPSHFNVVTIETIQMEGRVNYFKQLQLLDNPVVIIDNKLSRFQRVVQTHKDKLGKLNYLLFSNKIENIEKLSFAAFLQLESKQKTTESETELDPYE